MNNETTDRTTEDTNIKQQKIIRRDEADPNTPTTEGIYSLYDFDFPIPFVEADAHNYCFSGYFTYNYGVDTFYVRPINHMQINPTTGVILTEAQGFTFSYSAIPNVNSISASQTLLTTEVPISIDFKSYLVLYSTGVTEDSIW